MIHDDKIIDNNNSYLFIQDSVEKVIGLEYVKNIYLENFLLLLLFF